QEVVTVQEGPHQCFVPRRRNPESVMLWSHVQTTVHLTHDPLAHKVLQITIYSRGKCCQILSPVDPAGLHRLPQLFITAHRVPPVLVSTFLSKRKDTYCMNFGTYFMYMVRDGRWES